MLGNTAEIILDRGTPSGCDHIESDGACDPVRLDEAALDPVGLLEGAERLSRLKTRHEEGSALSLSGSPQATKSQIRSRRRR